MNRADHLAPGLAVVLAAACATTPLAPPPAPPVEAADAPGRPRIAHVADGDLTVGAIDGVPIGGISALAWQDGRLFALSDDRSQHGPSRFYEVALHRSGACLDVALARPVVLRQDGKPFPPGALDPEGLAPSPSGGLFVTSEGGTSADGRPRLLEFDLEGRLQRELLLPSNLAPVTGAGVRANLSLESLTVSPSGRTLFTATEEPLTQDGPRTTFEGGGRLRLQVMALTGKDPGTVRQLILPVGPIPASASIAPVIRANNGLVELLALSDTSLLAMERGAILTALGWQSRIALYLVDISNATPVEQHPSLAGRLPAGTRTVNRRLIGFLDDLAPGLTSPARRLDNIEAMTFFADPASVVSPGGEEHGATRPASGAPPHQRLRLLLASDDNFSMLQRTMFLAVDVDVTRFPRRLTQ